MLLVNGAVLTEPISLINDWLANSINESKEDIRGVCSLLFHWLEVSKFLLLLDKLAGEFGSCVLSLCIAMGLFYPSEKLLGNNVNAYVITVVGLLDTRISLSFSALNLETLA
jgi:hypothetical protein